MEDHQIHVVKNFYFGLKINARKCIFEAKIEFVWP